MENLTFNIHDIMILLGLIASIWAVYKIIKELSEPRKALEKQVDTLELWHKEDHHRIKEMEEQQKTALTAVLVNKLRQSRKETPREKAKNDKKP